MVLWNPSTGDYKILPNPCPSIKANYYKGEQLQGLGYCNGDYKMVRVIRDGEYGRVDVYTLKEMRNFDSPNIIGTAANGLIYWSDVYEYHDPSFKSKRFGF